MKKIGIVGTGLVGSCFKNLDDFEVVHRDEWTERVLDWAGIVNCCAIAGQKLCEDAGFDAVNQANVLLPQEMAYCSLNFDIPFITFSTSAVYARPTARNPLKESAPLYSHNLYAASKIVMEGTLPDSAFIFRIPMVITGSGAPNDFGQKVKGWRVVEDVEISIIYASTIKEAVKRVMMDTEIEPGIYNLASEAVHLPTFIKEEYGWEGEVVEADSLNLSPAIVFDTTKAEKAELM